MINKFSVFSPYNHMFLLNNMTLISLSNQVISLKNSCLKYHKKEKPNCEWRNKTHICLMIIYFIFISVIYIFYKLCLHLCVNIHSGHIKCAGGQWAIRIVYGCNGRRSIIILHILFLKYNGEE